MKKKSKIWIGYARKNWMDILRVYKGSIITPMIRKKKNTISSLGLFFGTKVKITIEELPE